jgi:nitroreductase
MEHLVLAAWAEGLGTCWIGAFHEETVKIAMGIPAEWRVVAMTPLGYPEQQPGPGSRKDLGEIISHSSFE